jgi:hypothetical protein
VVAKDAEGIIGLYTLIPENAVCWQIHATRCFGRRAIKAVRALVPWVFRVSQCRRIVAQIPAWNRLAIRHAEACGFRQYGVNPRSFSKDRLLHDQILLGVSPEEI